MVGKKYTNAEENGMNRTTMYSEKNTQHEVLLQRKQLGLKKKAQYHWSLLRDSIRSVIKAVEEADVKDLEITHGIHLERKLNHQEQISHVLYIPELKEYLTCDGHNFYFYSNNGQKRDTVQAVQKINRVIYSSQTSQFVGWVYGQEDLYLMSQELEVISQSKAMGRILLSAYNHSNGELITVGPHFITCWIFRYGARYLIPRKTTTINFGETNMFKTIVLEDTASQMQRIFFAQANGVVVYNAYSGVEVAHKKDLHAQPVTALTFFNPLKYTITGARDGCIKVWDTDWKIKMVFVGHSDQVNFLKIYSCGSAFISASLDCTLRVWNMDTCDEMDRVMINEPVEGMDTQEISDIFYTFAGSRVDLWKLQHLYYIHTNIGYRVQNIKVTSHQFFPQRALVLCRDSSIRIICPSNGEVITTLLMKQTEGLIDAAYSIAEDTIFAAMCNGDIVKSKTDQNPCEIVSRWTCRNSQDICNCLLVYEYVADPLGPSDVWSLSNQRSQTNKVRRFGRQHNIKNRTLLLGGQKDGYISVFDWHTGEITFKAEAHGSKGVLSMTANTRADQLISAGADNIIKIWRLYPFAQEALTPLMSFYCAHCPSFMTTIKMNLGVAFQDPSTATFSVVLYSLSDKNRFDHKPDDDHMDFITGFTACPRMKLYASSSRDGSVRVWSENNTLLRVLHLNTVIHSLAFCSPQGDLLVGIDNHLFHIPHSKFLPKSYKKKQVCMKFLPVKSEQPLPYNESRLNLMEKSDVKRLQNSHAAFMQVLVTDVLPSEEQMERLQENKIKEEAFRLLELRENEIKQIRDGALRSQNKPKSTKKTQNVAFREYMKIYYNKEKEKNSIYNECPKETLKKKLVGESNPGKEDKYRPEEAPYGFFSEMGQKFLEQDPSSLLHQCYPSGPSGILPNSVLIKILHPPPVPEEVPWEMIPYQPPELTSQQLAEIRLYKRQGIEEDVGDLVTFTDDDDRLSRVLEIDLTDDDDNEVQKKTKSDKSSDKTLRKMLNTADFKTSRKTQPSKRKKRNVNSENDSNGDDDDDDDKNDGIIIGHPVLSGKSSSLMSRLQDIINKPKPEIQEDNEETPKPAPPSKAVKCPIAILAKPVTKFISHPEVMKPQAATTPARSPTPSSSVTPLPYFIKQFVTTEWFKKYFPNCNENTMPKPWTSDTFIMMISKLLRLTEWTERVYVTEAILCVYISEGLNASVIMSVSRTLLAVLNHHDSPPVCSVTEQKAFILSALKTLAALAVKDKDVITEIMVQFLTGDKDVRSVVIDVMTNLGLVDPHRQFQKELDSWDTWTIDENNLRKELHNMCDQWLEKWMTSYKMRIKDSVELLHQGHSLQGHISNIRSVSGGASKSKSNVKTAEKESVISSQDIAKTGQLMSTDSARNGHVLDGSFTVTLDSIHSQSIMESVNFLDAVTYFCEIMTDKELEALKKGKLLREKQGDKVVHAKNTVLVLPRISQKPALVRLGEMHASQCRPERETTLHTDFHMPSVTVRGRHPAPGDLGSFVSCINLPMKTVYLNPFLSANKERDAFLNQPILITLKLSQKYFILSHSYVPLQNHVALGS